MAYEKVKFLNIDVDNITMDELLGSFQRGLLLTLHVDMLLKLQRDRDFYDIVPNFDIVTCDSQILFFASKILGTPLKERVSGSDYFTKFYLKNRDNLNVKIFICGAAPGVAETARKNINSKVGREMVVGTYSPSLSFESSPTEMESIVAQINKSKATVLVVALGAGRQEKFIIKCKDRLQNVGLFFPIGGAVDYEAGVLKRPSPWVSNCGFEWLYRVICQPRQRWYRYFIYQPPIFYLLLLQFFRLYKNPFKH